MKPLILSAVLILSAATPAITPAWAAEVTTIESSVSVEPTERFLDIRSVTSDGGITAWFLEDHSVPAIAIEFAFAGAGASLDPQDKQGLARLASNTLDEGAADMDSQAFQKTLTDNSISLRFDVGRDDFFGSLKSLTRHRDLATDLMAKALTSPRFDQDPIDRMKAANISRIKSQLSDPDWIAARIMNDVAFAGHPYAMNSGGTVSGFAAITADDLRHFTATSFARDNLLVAVAGDITEDELKPLLDKMFGALPEKSQIQTIPDLTIQGGNTITLFDKDVPQTSIQMMQGGIDRSDPDYHAAQVMNFILGSSGFGSRLTEEIREKRGLTYGIYSSMYQLDHVKALSVSTSTRNDKAGEVMDLIRTEWIKMRDEPVSADELKAAQDYLTGSMPLALTSTQGIAGLILGLRLDDLPIDYLDGITARYNAITVDDVARVSKRLLTPDAMTTVIVGKPEGITPTTTRTDLPNVE